MESMTVLMIGGTGVLSTAVTNEALQLGIKVTMINRGHRLNKITKDVELILSDKDDKVKIKKKLAGRSFNAVIDFLCYNEMELENSFRFYSEYTNQYFFISSAAVYNNSIPGICNEDHEKVQPLWSYSVNKWKSELKLKELAHNSNCKYTIVRPMVTYDDTRIPYGIAPLYGFHWTLVARILHDKPIITWNNGSNRCNMMRVEDFAVGLVGLIGNEASYNEAFNICGDETPSFKEVLDVIGKYVGHEVKTIDIDPVFYAKQNPGISGELLGGRAITTIIDNSKIKSIVPSFNPSITIEDGIKKTLDSYKNQNFQKGIDWNFEALTDKTILHWCKFKHLPCNKYRHDFIDYLNNASFKDKCNYFLKKNSNNFFISKYLNFDMWLRKTLHVYLK